MEALTPKERERIFADYKEAQSYINPIVNGEITNLLVREPHQYLAPTICSERVPLDDDRGELMHYTKIRNVLEKVLSGQPAEQIIQFHKAPDYIKDKLQSSEPATSDSQ